MGQASATAVLPGRLSRGTVLAVDDEIENLDLIRRLLSRDFQVLVATSGEEALELLATTPVSVIVADMRMPKMNGAQFLREAMRAQPAARRLLLTAYADVDAIVSAINDGQVHHFVQKPFDPAALRTVVQQLGELHNLETENQRLLKELQDANEELKEKEVWLSTSLDNREQELFATVKELQAKNLALQELALRDGLTGLYNHRSFQERLQEELARAKRNGSSLALIICDVDHFKRFNDTYGHPAGDAILKSVALVFSGNAPQLVQARQSDVCARYGGEEFAFILPDTNKDGASIRAERLRQALAKTPVEGPKGLTLSLSASFGVAGFPEDGGTAEELIACADSALIRAKQNGRNQVVVWVRQQKNTLTVITNPREVHSELVGRLRRDRALCVLTLIAPDLMRLGEKYGRGPATKVTQALHRAVPTVARELLEASGTAIVVAPRQEVVELFLSAETIAEPSARYLEQLAETLAKRTEELLRKELHGTPGLMRVVGAVARRLFARDVSVDHQLQELSDEGRSQAFGMLHQRRTRSKFDVQKIILEGHLRSVVQPVVGARDKQVVGYEILARGPAESLLESPVVLLDSAEDIGLLPDLDLAMVEVALKTAVRLPPECLIFVNVLAGTLGAETFLSQDFPRMLSTLGIDSQRVVIELSERQSADHIGHFLEVVEKARQAGYTLCLDDVGTNHANLSEIAVLRPSWFKLDRSLVTGVHQSPVRRDLIESLAEFGRKQGTKVVAEGIESSEEVEVLKQLGIEFFQGYYFGRPGNVEDVGRSERK